MGIVEIEAYEMNWMKVKLQYKLHTLSLTVHDSTHVSNSKSQTIDNLSVIHQKHRPPPNHEAFQIDHPSSVFLVRS